MCTPKYSYLTTIILRIQCVRIHDHIHNKNKKLYFIRNGINKLASVTAFIVCLSKLLKKLLSKDSIQILALDHLLLLCGNWVYYHNTAVA